MIGSTITCSPLRVEEPVRFIGGSKHNKFLKVPASFEEVSEPAPVAKKATPAFKEGDKVRCVDQGEFGLITVGSTYTVLEALAGSNSVKIRGDENDLYTYPAELFELASAHKQFKVGDRVRCVNAKNNVYIKTGEVFEVLGVGGVYTTVQTKNHGRQYYSNDLFELVEEPKPLDIKQLKVGSRVRCVKAYPAWLTVGEVYEVTQVFPPSIAVRGDCGMHGSFLVSEGNFELVSGAPEAPEKFKVGDRIRCVDAGPNRITNGYVYTVAELGDVCGEPGVRLKCDSGSLGLFFARRFVHHHDTKPAPTSPPPEKYTRRTITLADDLSRYSETCFVIDGMTNTEAALVLRDLASTGKSTLRLPKVITTKPLAHRASTLISALGYDRDTKTLDVTMKHNQATYRYSGVTPETLGLLLSSDSLGSAYNSLIKGVHKSCFLD